MNNDEYKHVELTKVLCSKIHLTPYDNRRMKLVNDITIMLHLKDEGVQKWTAKKGYISDGRSGGIFIDFILPHWGNKLYAQAVLLHDFMYSSQLVSQEMANDIFEQMLKRAGIGKIRRKLAIRAVSSYFGDAAYDSQDKQDKLNLNKVNIEWQA